MGSIQQDRDYIQGRIVRAESVRDQCEEIVEELDDHFFGQRKSLSAERKIRNVKSILLDQIKAIDCGQIDDPPAKQSPRAVVVGSTELLAAVLAFCSAKIIEIVSISTISEAPFPKYAVDVKDRNDRDAIVALLNIIDNEEEHWE